ncbi:DUF5703 domain-containing protein [Flavobacterium sp.]|uniref:DUF5703 domain-containing protein n=1 Tax=Flavobacterium sp. TaxID=239 RepID=UPI00286E5A05|nr:DUF5703 domain-containing protein [Flavobacterium sp.]
MKCQQIHSLISVGFLFFGIAGFSQSQKLKDYNVIWSSPGLNSQGSIPLGNGDIGVNAWVEENGDLVFYVSKTDAWSETGELLKLGKIRVSITPSPKIKAFFYQELKLEQGEMVVEFGQTKVKLWIDANHPTIQVDVDSKILIKVQVSFETWRTKRKLIEGDEMFSLYGIDEVGKDKKFFHPVYREADTTLVNQSNKIISGHHNHYSQWKNNLELQALGDFANTQTDPLLDRTFGVCIEGRGLISTSEAALVSDNLAKHFQINVYPFTKIGTIDSWKKELLENKEVIQNLSPKSRLKAHHKWWKQFWNRHYIFISAKDPIQSQQAQSVTRGYILQRYVNACGGRGNSPIKFNGSIFTVDTYNRQGINKGLNADFRAWGGSYWWQNTRLPYWSMLVSGDFDLMQPLFKMYNNVLPLRKAATQIYYNHDGAFFPETMNFWGTYNNKNYGTNRKNLVDGYTTNPNIRYYWSGGLELSLIMLDYYSFTNNQQFAKDTLVPFVSEILTFFDQHWKRGDDGKILFSPALALETYHTAVNPLPEIVGIKKIAQKMMALPKNMISEIQIQQWKTLINDLPPMPLQFVKNDTIIAPAQEYSDKKNVENPELYAIFPYRTFGIGKPNFDLAKRTFDAKVHKENKGWQQNSIQAAYLGMTKDAQEMIVESFSTWDKNFKFPAFWGPNYDWTPDQDHGTVAMIALQRMILQYEDANIYLLPAWPKEWDVHFKVNATNNTTIEAEFKNGKISELNVTPKGSVKLNLNELIITKTYEN